MRKDIRQQAEPKGVYRVKNWGQYNKGLIGISPMVRQVRRRLCLSRQGNAAQAGQLLASGRDVRHFARRALSAVARGRRARRRTGRTAAEAARQGCCQTLLPAGAAFLPGAAQDHHRPVTQLPGGQGRYPGTGERQARVRQSQRSREQPSREQPPAHTRTRAAHARDSVIVSVLRRSCRALVRSGSTSP